MKIFMIAIVSLLVMFSCKKSNDSTPEMQIAAKWNLVRSVTTDPFSGTNNSNYNPGDYMQIDKDGKCYIRVSNAVHETTWKLLDNDRRIWFAQHPSLDLADDGYEIKVLTNSNLELYSKEPAAGGFYEATIFMEK